MHPEGIGTHTHGMHLGGIGMHSDWTQSRCIPNEQSLIGHRNVISDQKKMIIATLLVVWSPRRRCSPSFPQYCNLVIYAYDTLSVAHTYPISGKLGQGATIHRWVGVIWGKIEPRRLIQSYGRKGVIIDASQWHVTASYYFTLQQLPGQRVPDHPEVHTRPPGYLGQIYHRWGHCGLEMARFVFCNVKTPQTQLILPASGRVL